MRAMVVRARPLGFLALALIVGAQLAGCSSTAAGEGGWAESAHLVAGRRVGPVIRGGSWAFVASTGDGTLTELDRSSGRPIATIPVSDEAALIAHGRQPSSVHALSFGSWLRRDRDAPHALAWDDGSLGDRQRRAAGGRGGPCRHAIARTIDLPGRGFDLAISGGTAWVTGYRTNQV